MSAAARAGLSTNIWINDSEENGADVGALVLSVRGLESAIRAAKLVPDKFRLPKRTGRYWSRLRAWDFRRIADNVFEARTSDEEPETVTKLGSVQAITWADTYCSIERRGFWGDVAAVESAAGLEPGTLERNERSRRLWKRGWKTGGDGNEDRRWEAKYYPSGRVLYSEELEKPGWQEELQARRPKERDASYSSPEAFAEGCEDFAWLLTRCIAHRIGGDAEREAFGDCTIHYDAKTVEAISEALDHACQILQGAMPGFVGRAKLERQRIKGARADATFQAFLGRVTHTRRGKQ
jgi:hypothetical protein